MRSFIGTILASAALVACGDAREEVGTNESELVPTPNKDGIADTFHTSGKIDTSNPFFLPLGTNDRTCASCHDGHAGWTITPTFSRIMFTLTGGTAPLFRPHDGANNPNADLSTVEKRRAGYSMLIERGLVRFTRTIAPTSELTVVAVDDPYGFSTPEAFSNFRRVLPVGNVARSSSLTWTGGPHVVATQLEALMVGATRFHGQTTETIPPEQAKAGAEFMLGLSFAQAFDWKVGRLDIAGANGGAANLSREPFYEGINALTGDSRTGAPFHRESFTIFEAWEDLHGNYLARERAKIARGQEIFYDLEFDIKDVPGLNDELGQPVLRGTCTTCHNTPNVGGHSTTRFINLGIADASRRTPDTPLVTVRNKTTGEELRTTDLGRALSSGKWADIGKFKVPVLRGVGVRAPYFHDGSAKNLHEVLDFYERRFGVKLKGATREDLIAFLEAI